MPPSSSPSCVLTSRAACCVANGTTSYSENVGAIGLTGVGSRRVIQTAACMMVVLSVIGKFGALFASLPTPIVGGLFCVMFGMIAGVGLANMQYANQASMRNIFILGFALFNGLSIPAYFTKFTESEGHGPVDTGSQEFNGVPAVSAFTPAMPTNCPVPAFCPCMYVCMYV